MKLTTYKMDGTIKTWRVVAAILVFLTAAYVSLTQPKGIDFWLQVKIGDLILTNHSIPSTLLFPFTEVAEQGFYAHEWLASVLFSLLIREVGVNGLPFVVALLGLAYVAAVVWFTYERSERNLAVALCGGVIALLTENYRHVLRPELLTLFVMVVYWGFLERIQKGAGWPIKVGALLLVTFWANLHGSFVIGPTLAGLYAVGAYIDAIVQRRALACPSAKTLEFAVLAGLAVLTCLINPQGWEMLRFAISFSNSHDISVQIVEWMPTLDARFRGLFIFWIFVSVWLLTLLCMLVRRKDAGATEWLVFLFFSYLSIKAIRFPIYLGLVSAYLCTPLLAQRLHTVPRTKWCYGVLIAFSVSALMLSFRFGNLHGSSPVALGDWKLSDPMVSALRDERRSGNVFNSMEMGAELIYWAYPRLKPVSDCRVDSYGFEYLNFLRAVFIDEALFREFVARYDVRYMLIDRVRFDYFVTTSRWARREWEVVLMDSHAVFLRRSDVPY